MTALSAKLPRWLPWLGAALVVVPTCFWLASGSADPEADWVEVKREDLRLSVEVTGTLKAIDSNLIGPPQVVDVWDYKIAHMAPEGSQVKKGTPVLGFDTSELERRLDEKKAESEAAQKELEKREIDLGIKRRDDDLKLAEADSRRRKSQLKVDRPGDLAAASELYQARLDLELAQHEIDHLTKKIDSERKAIQAEMASLRQQRERAEQRVREIESAIGRMTVPAPRDGTVIYVSNWRDEKKKVGDSCWRGEKVLEVPDLERMNAQAEVDEADAGKIAEGQRVSLRLDAHPDVEFAGKIQLIWGTVQRKSWNDPRKVVRLDVALDRTDRERMRPGMRFTGTVETGLLPRVLAVPVDAVFPTADGPVAWRRTRFGTERVRLTLGRRTERAYEVLGGLDERDRVSRRDLGRKERAS